MKLRMLLLLPEHMQALASFKVAALYAHSLPGIQVAVSPDIVDLGYAKALWVVE